jgi:hypothetical protein
MLITYDMLRGLGLCRSGIASICESAGHDFECFKKSGADVSVIEKIDDRRVQDALAMIRGSSCQAVTR